MKGNKNRRALSAGLAVVLALGMLPGGALRAALASGAETAADFTETREMQESSPGEQTEPVQSEAEETFDSTDAGQQEETVLSGAVCTYEDEQVEVTVQSRREDPALAGASLIVQPVLSGEAYEKAGEKAQEAASAQDAELKGYLAYDISFVRDGVPVEPTETVDVSMTFKQAVLPAEDVGDSERISVLHLKETGESIQTEDVTESVKSAQNKAVEEVSFSADSFSVFTITWSRTGVSLPVKCVDDKGNEIGQLDKGVTTDARDGRWRSVEELANIRSFPGYTFSCAMLRSLNQNDGGIEIKSLRSRNGIVEYSTQSGNAISTENTAAVGTDMVYFVYGFENTTGLDTIQTVDSRNAGIALHVFDYTKAQINTGKTLHFCGGGEDVWYNRYNVGGNTGIKEGIVQKKLNGGFPVLSTGINAGNQSLAYLFNPAITTGGKTAYADANHLFKMQDGYYYYNSADNYAYLNQSSKDFTVYNKPAAPTGTAAMYKIGNFFPFNVLSGDANEKTDVKGLLNMQSGSQAQSVNYGFGLTMEATFAQPKGGKLSDKSMLFEFTGDDDVWVFIDDVLVLDLGGIHDAMSGSIDFSTGIVTRTGKTATTLKELFAAAQPNNEGYFTGDTFKDYTEHTIKFFYLERGEGASNCKLKFNIPPLPRESLTVAKEIDGDPSGRYRDADFSFRLYKDAEEDGTGGLKGTLVQNTEYKLLDSANQLIDTGRVGEDGIFTLKASQKAQFIDLGTVGTRCYAEEVQVSEELCSKVTVSTSIDEWEVSTEDVNTVQSPSVELGSQYLITYVNHMQRASLTIIKEIDRADVVNGDPIFTFRIQCPDGEILYRTIRFDRDTSTDASQSVTIEDLPVGIYEIQELSSLRYTSVTPNPQSITLQGPNGLEGTAEFRNEKTYMENYSHTDMVVNHFTVGEDRQVTISRSDDGDGKMKETENEKR